jgi:hypothetical protein
MIVPRGLGVVILSNRGDQERKQTAANTERGP